MGKSKSAPRHLSPRRARVSCAITIARRDILRSECSRVLAALPPRNVGKSLALRSFPRAPYVAYRGPARAMRAARRRYGVQRGAVARARCVVRGSCLARCASLLLVMLSRLPPPPQPPRRHPTPPAPPKRRRRLPAPPAPPVSAVLPRQYNGARASVCRLAGGSAQPGDAARERCHVRRECRGAT